MSFTPSFSSLTTAVRNAWALSPVGPGIEPYDGLPTAVVRTALHGDLHRYCPWAPVTAPRPVLLVPPLAVSVRCYDLRPKQSLASHLVESGRATYVVDYGAITFADRNLGFEEWIDRIVPDAIAAVSAAHDGADVDVVGWSLGGTISLLTASAHADLPIATITAYGTPIDYSLIPALRPLRIADQLLGTRAVTRPTAAMGGVPRHLVRISYRAMAPQRELTKALHLARSILDTETLARTEAIDDFIGSMPGYPGRAYHQIHARLMTRNDLAGGTVHLSADRAVELSRIQAPTLFIGSATDNIADGPAVAAGADVVPGARYVAADGLSHLGLIAGPKAPQLSWSAMDAFLAGVPTPTPA